MWLFDKPDAPLPTYTVESLQNALLQISIQYIFLGIHFCLVIQACYILWKRGLRRSPSRQGLMAIVLTMLGVSTTHSILSLHSFILQGLKLGPDPPNMIQRLLSYDLTFTCLARLNFCLSDSIVAWRAWALWPGKTHIRWTLGICLALTWALSIASSTADVIVADFKLVESGAATLSTMRTWSNHLELLMYIPMLSTNIYATGAISYRAWLHRKDIREFLPDSFADEHLPTRQHCRDSFQTLKILAILIETGGLYIIFLALCMITDDDIFKMSRAEIVFWFVWRAIMVSISGIYPTLIILLVSQHMSQGDFTTSSHKRTVIVPSHSRDPPVLSAIRFHSPISDADCHSFTFNYPTRIRDATPDDGKVYEEKTASDSSMVV